MQSFQRPIAPRGKSWLAVDLRTGQLGLVPDPAHRMGSAFFRDGKWHPISELTEEKPLVFIDELAGSAFGETLAQLVQDARNN